MKPYQNAKGVRSDSDSSQVARSIVNPHFMLVSVQSPNPKPLTGNPEPLTPETLNPELLVVAMRLQRYLLLGEPLPKLWVRHPPSFGGIFYSPGLVFRVWGLRFWV